MLDGYNIPEKIGVLTALGGIISGIFLASVRLFRSHLRLVSEHNQMLETIRVNNQLIPRFLATEEAVEFLKQTQEQQLIELRGLRADLTLLMTRLIKSLDR